jgi:hypothetical protein
VKSLSIMGRVFPIIGMLFYGLVIGGVDAGKTKIRRIETERRNKAEQAEQTRQKRRTENEGRLINDGQGMLD